MILLLLFSGDSAFVNITGYDEYLYQGKYLISGVSPYFFYPYVYHENRLKMEIDGSAGNGFSIDGHVYLTRRKENDDVYFRVYGNSFSLEVGDVETSPGNLLVHSKKIRGVNCAYNHKLVRAEGFYSLHSGKAWKEMINGDGTTGPFFLSHSPVLKNTEVIYRGEGLDLVKLQRGKDYTIDYTLGRIVLKEPLSEDERMKVVYEYQQEEKMSMSGLRGIFQPVEWFGIGFSEVDGNAYSLETRIGVSPAEWRMEYAREDSGSALRLSGNLKSGFFSMSGFYKTAYDSFVTIGNEMEEGNVAGFHSDVFLGKTLRFSGNFTYERDEKQTSLMLNSGHFFYNYSVFSGRSMIIKHNAGIKGKVSGVTYKVGVGKCVYDTLKGYTSSIILEKRTRDAGFSGEFSFARGGYTEYGAKGKVFITGGKRFNLTMDARVLKSTRRSDQTCGELSFYLAPFSFISTSNKLRVDQIRKVYMDTTLRGVRLVYSGNLRFYRSPYLDINFMPSGNMVNLETGRMAGAGRGFMLNTTAVPFRNIRMGYLFERRRQYERNLNGEMVVNNRSRGERFNLSIPLNDRLNITGEYLFSSDSGIYRITLPSDSTDTIYEWRNTMKNGVTGGIHWKLGEGDNLILTIGKQREGIFLPDSQPVDMEENFVKGKGEMKKGMFGIYEEISYGKRDGRQQGFTGVVHYEFVGFETGVSFLPLKGIRGKVSYYYSLSYGEINPKEGRLSIRIDSNLEKVNINLTMNDNRRSIPESHTLEFRLNARINFK